MVSEWASGRLARYTYAKRSSAKDQLTGQAVAVKKIMKPFSTPVLSKRTYRELKLLKHLKHENVRCAAVLGHMWTLQEAEHRHR